MDVGDCCFVVNRHLRYMLHYLCLNLEIFTIMYTTHQRYQRLSRWLGIYCQNWGFSRSNLTIFTLEHGVHPLVYCMSYFPCAQKRIPWFMLSLIDIKNQISYSTLTTCYNFRTCYKNRNHMYVLIGCHKFWIYHRNRNCMHMRGESTRPACYI